MLHRRGPFAPITFVVFVLCFQNQRFKQKQLCKFCLDQVDCGPLLDVEVAEPVKQAQLLAVVDQLELVNVQSHQILLQLC